MQKNGFFWSPLLIQAEPWNGRVSAASYRCLPPPTHLQNKEAEREVVSRQVELHTDALGSLQLMQGRLYCAEPRCFYIQYKQKKPIIRQVEACGYKEIKITIASVLFSLCSNWTHLYRSASTKTYQHTYIEE